jgi:hypothetical protein
MEISSALAHPEDGTPAPPEKGNQFDAEFCGRIIRIAAVCFVVALVVEFVFFSLVKSANCPGWQTPTEKEGGMVWAIWLIAAVWTFNIVYHAFRWHKFSRKIIDTIEWGTRIYIPGTNPTWLTDPTQFKAMCAVKNDANSILIAVLIGSAFVAALPVLTRIGCLTGGGLTFAPYPNSDGMTSSTSAILSDHGPKRIACDSEWGTLHLHTHIRYQDFLRTCMNGSSRGP